MSVPAADHRSLRSQRPAWLAAAIGDRILSELEMLVEEHPHKTAEPGCGACSRIETLRSWVNGALESRR